MWLVVTRHHSADQTNFDRQLKLRRFKWERHAPWSIEVACLTHILPHHSPMSFILNFLFCLSWNSWVTSVLNVFSHLCSHLCTVDLEQPKCFAINFLDFPSLRSSKKKWYHLLKITNYCLKYYFEIFMSTYNALSHIGGQFFFPCSFHSNNTSNFNCKTENCFLHHQNHTTFIWRIK